MFGVCIIYYFVIVLFRITHHRRFCNNPANVLTKIAEVRLLNFAVICYQCWLGELTLFYRNCLWPNPGPVSCCWRREPVLTRAQQACIKAHVKQANWRVLLNTKTAADQAVGLGHCQSVEKRVSSPSQHWPALWNHREIQRPLLKNTYFQGKVI